MSDHSTAIGDRQGIVDGAFGMAGDVVQSPERELAAGPAL
jgi:hypothetical protein